MKNIGFTTSIPVEVIFAAGHKPVDLNNIFINSKEPGRWIEKAENYGFPRNTCAWIKGIYSAIQNCEDIDTIVGVVEGDCSNTKALIEVLELKKINCIPFSFPVSRNYDSLKNEVYKLIEYFRVSMDDCIAIKKKIDGIRQKVMYLDNLTWEKNKASGFENHLWQISTSDFNGNISEFDREISDMINEIQMRESIKPRIRLGYIGVPPINSDIYDFIETLDAKIVFNEVQRQFTMAHGIGNDDITEVYRQFTYPYALVRRLKDIMQEINNRNIDGIIHYTQAFCFRGIEDIVIREKLPVPVLTLEGDRPGKSDARTRLRIESFVDMLKS